jgi:hypothetical protein
VIKRLFPAALLAVLLLAVGAAGVSAAPAAAGVTRVNWSSYLSHSIAASDKWMSLLDDEGYALDLSDDYLIGKADLALRNYARKEYRWFTSHKPTSSCFVAVWNSEKAEAHWADLAFTDLARYWSNWPGVSDSIWSRGMKYYSRWNTQTERTTTLLDRTNC